MEKREKGVFIIIIIIIINIIIIIIIIINIIIINIIIVIVIIVQLRKGHRPVHRRSAGVRCGAWASGAHVRLHHRPAVQRSQVWRQVLLRDRSDARGLY